MTQFQNGLLTGLIVGVFIGIALFGIYQLWSDMRHIEEINRHIEERMTGEK